MKLRSTRFAAKAGYAARGVMYLILGGLAVAGAAGAGGSAANAKGALLKLFDTGYGTALLAILGLGLFCYAAWRLIQALADADRHGAGAKGLTLRIGLFASALTHAALGVWALTTALFGGESGENGGKSGAVALLLEQPFGPWLVALAGACVIGAGLAHIWKGVNRGFEKWFQADESTMKLIRPISILGLTARGVVFLIIGGLVIFAGLTADPQKAGGIGAALNWLQQQPYGLYLFSVAAVGLFCFGVYSLAEAFYRRIALAN